MDAPTAIQAGEHRLLMELESWADSNMPEGEARVLAALGDLPMSYRKAMPMNRLHPLFRATVEERERQNRSRASVADDAGYDNKTMAGWEQGKLIPNLPAFVDLVNTLGGEVVVRFGDREYRA